MALYEKIENEIENVPMGREKKPVADDCIFKEAEGCYLLKFEVPEVYGTNIGIFEVYGTEVNEERQMDSLVIQGVVERQQQTERRAPCLKAAKFKREQQQQQHEGQSNQACDSSCRPPS